MPYRESRGYLTDRNPIRRKIDFAVGVVLGVTSIAFMSVFAAVETIKTRLTQYPLPPAE